MSYLGVELGSTRIKAVKIDKEYSPISSGDYTWVSKFENGIWTYDINKAWDGLKTALGGIDNINDRVFKNVDAVTVQPDVEDMNGFDKYTENYIRLLELEKSAIENI